MTFLLVFAESIRFNITIRFGTAHTSPLTWFNSHPPLHSPPNPKLFLAYDLYAQFCCHKFKTLKFSTTKLLSPFQSTTTTAAITPFFKIFVFKFEQSSYLFSLKNSRPCRDLNPDLPGTKPICYQLSYPGLDGFQRVIYKRDSMKGNKVVT